MAKKRNEKPFFTMMTNGESLGIVDQQGIKYIDPVEGYGSCQSCKPFVGIKEKPPIPPRNPNYRTYDNADQYD